MNDADNLVSDENSKVEDGDVVKDSPAPVIDSSSVLLNLEQLIKTHITRIDALKIDAKKQKEMLDDIFTNDDTYKEHNEKAKEAARVKSMTKGQIMKRPNVAEIAEKLKNMKQETKELDAALSDYLGEYQRLSGSNEVQTEEGEVREIIYVAKLVKKASRFKK
jgi:hypothetical protein